MKTVNEQLDFDINELTDQQLVDLYFEPKPSIPKQKSDCNKKVKAEIDAKKQRKAQRKARAKQRGYATDGFLVFCMLIAVILISFTMAVNA
tara:strand:+ start:90 stop:362 length:273 start_codon:yes stop_codon:yes gene_type:complete